jgi:hypothetical protein
MAVSSYRMEDDSVTVDGASAARTVGKSTSRRGEDVVRDDKTETAASGRHPGRGERPRGTRGPKAVTSVNPQDVIDKRMTYMPPP